MLALLVTALAIAAMVRSCSTTEDSTVSTPVPSPVVDCKVYPFKHHSKHLNDRLPAYKKRSQQAGVPPIADEKVLDKLVAQGGSGLVRVASDATLFVAPMEHGRPYLTANARKTLLAIGRDFQERIAGTDLSGARLRVTSLLRTRKDQRDLGRSNVNATKDVDAPHTHGTSMDISYMKFMAHDDALLELAACQQVFLAETLAEVIAEHRKRDPLLFATREARQACYHLSVCR